MKRWILKAGSTDLEGLVLEDVPMPEPGVGEVRIRIQAVSLNYRDQLVLNGGFGGLPDRDVVPVSDGVGEIDAIGAGVEIWAVGDRVTGLLFPWIYGAFNANLGIGLGSLSEDGMLAESVVLRADRVVRPPANLDDAEAATLPCAALTAWNALYGDHPIGSSSKVLVLGSGSVSLFALLFARAAGAQVIATSSQDMKVKRLFALGASDVLNYKDIPDWGNAVFEKTGGVDKVVDVVGAGMLNQSLAAVGYGGEVALVGLMTAGDFPPGAGWQLLSRAALIRAIAVGNAEMYAAMSRVIEMHQIRPPIDQRFSFKNAKDAYRSQLLPDRFGKIVIDVA